MNGTPKLATLASPRGGVSALRAAGRALMPAPQRFKHAAIVGKPQAQGMGELLEEVARFLTQQGLAVSLEAATAQATGIRGYDVHDAAQVGRHCDLAVVVGGDGTMLGIARELARHDVPLIGINQGRLGFITDIPVDRFREALPPMVRGEFEEEHRSMIDAAVWRDGACIFSGVALNDVVVSRGATAGMVELRVDIGDEFVANMRADGLIVASPTGSTATRCRRAGRSCIRASAAGCWCPTPRTRCRTARSCCPTTARCASPSSRRARPRPISTCRAWPTSSTATRCA
jgi:NAD+ kinase